MTLAACAWAVGQLVGELLLACALVHVALDWLDPPNGDAPATRERDGGGGRSSGGVQGVEGSPNTHR